NVESAHSQVAGGGVGDREGEGVRGGVRAVVRIDDQTRVYLLLGELVVHAKRRAVDGQHAVLRQGVHRIDERGIRLRKATVCNMKQAAIDGQRSRSTHPRLRRNREARLRCASGGSAWVRLSARISARAGEQSRQARVKLESPMTEPPTFRKVCV